MFDTLIVRGLSELILLGYFVTGRAGQIQNFYDYPQFYQNMVLRLAAKRAGERQNAVIAEYKSSLKAAS